MKKSILSICLFLSLTVLLLGCGRKETVRGNGNIVKKEIAISDYQDILLGGNGVKVNYTQSDDGPYLQIECDQNILNLLHIESKENVLRIRPQNKDFTLVPSRFTITTRSSKLRNIKMGGSTDFLVHDSLVCDRLNIDMVGKSNIRIDSLAVEQLDCNSAGNGNFELKGTATKTKFKSVGKNTFGTIDLRTDNFDAQTMGKTDVEITVLKRIAIKNLGKLYVTYQTEGNKISRNFNSLGSATYHTLP